VRKQRPTTTEPVGYFEQVKGEKEGKSSFEILSSEAGGISPGAEGLIFLPYMAGERSPIWDENAKGVFFGLDYSKTRSHMVRAVMEGVAFSLLHNVEVAKEAGADIKSFNAMGGSSNSVVWTQIKSDVTGIPINVAKSDTATTWGAAVLAGVGAGLYKGFDDAMKNSVKIKRTHTPNMENYEKYRKYYELYIELYDKLKMTMGKINDKEL
jgi:xylulokinase